LQRVCNAGGKQMVRDRFLPPEDLNDPIDQAVAIYDWAVNPVRQ
jgi:hypothetical protein